MTAGRRWRCLALLGVVYGLVLLLQVGLPYVAMVMMLAGGAAALVGRVRRECSGGATVIAVAIVFELTAGLTAPVKILLASAGGEPVLWALWLAEWPLRIAGAALGVLLAWRLLRQPAPLAHEPALALARPQARRPRRATTVGAVGLLALMLLGATLPMMLETWTALTMTAVGFTGVAAWMGLRWGIVRVLLGLLWGWVIFALASYAWHQQTDRVIDLIRTSILRFTPMSLMAVLIVRAVRPVDYVRLLRGLGLPGFVLLPLAQVARSLPRAIRQVSESIRGLRGTSKWGGLRLLLHPLRTARAVCLPLSRQFASELRGSPSAPVPAASCRVSEISLANGGTA
jgi:hypothetical protein